MILVNSPAQLRSTAVLFASLEDRSCNTLVQICFPFFFSWQSITHLDFLFGQTRFPVVAKDGKVASHAPGVSLVRVPPRGDNAWRLSHPHPICVMPLQQTVAISTSVSWEVAPACLLAASVTVSHILSSEDKSSFPTSLLDRHWAPLGAVYPKRGA